MDPQPKPDTVRGRPTMKDLADHVGVSRQLVSLVLRDLPGASADTRRRVHEAAAELGYHPDASARMLRGRRSFQLGVVFTMREPFEADLVEALIGEAAARGYSLVLGPLTTGRSQADVIAQLLGQRIEGLVVLATDDGGAAMSGLPARIPVVQLGGPIADVQLDDVRVDDAIGIGLLVDHLVSLGHRQIVHATGGSGPNASSRRDEYVGAMRRHGLEPDVVESAYTEQAGSAAAVALLERPTLPTALMAANDRCAVGALATLARRNVAVPETISVVGFDDSSVARLPFIQLTTVRHEPARLAAQALEAIIARIDDPDRPTVVHRDAPELVVRQSTGPARDR
ncbi:LacI family DNA-binding transcriptional regulator [Curtobacterium sp. VKM Ac-2922]|uniref:LacI family DNA-binding transcriptional regulator n=1 Tax=Curtobacterium sp. VKM Ac-2922 TaxID=2929475 RepID=UPI001FB408E1|nr:LacI family DNA-binding transcriptional regulator [Curtobacterium sp. VKM Ac-2922]MCJ1715843.1 LacI family transcriptional regulator [Curtobacterium sp. VKM Ac-2922]